MPSLSRLLERRSVILGILVIVTAGLWVATSLAARSYRHEERSLAKQWFALGEAALAKGNSEAAVGDFRTALAYSPQWTYRLQLAQALLQSGREDEARAHLVSLWEEEPANAAVNLDLARLAARKDDVQTAEKYYHSAIYGVWENENPVTVRTNVRLELADFLLRHGDNASADAELEAAIPNLPNDPAQHVRVADMMVRAGDLHSAMAEYEKALKIDPHSVPALTGAGAIAFRIGDYRTARKYLEVAVQLGAGNAQTTEELRVAEAVLQLDPFAPRLTLAERARRTVQVFRYPLERLRACAGKSAQGTTPANLPSFEPLYARARAWQPLTERRLERNPDMIDAVMDWAATAEAAATRTCGPPSGPDLAISLLTKNGLRHP